MVRVSGSASRPPDGFDSGRSFLTTRLNQLEKRKAGRVETKVSMSEELWPGLLLNQLRRDFGSGCFFVARGNAGGTAQVQDAQGVGEGVHLHHP